MSRQSGGLEVILSLLPRTAVCFYWTQWTAGTSRNSQSDSTWQDWFSIQYIAGFSHDKVGVLEHFRPDDLCYDLVNFFRSSWTSCCMINYTIGVFFFYNYFIFSEGEPQGRLSRTRMCKKETKSNVLRSTTNCQEIFCLFYKNDRIELVPN